MRVEYEPGEVEAEFKSEFKPLLRQARQHAVVPKNLVPLSPAPPMRLGRFLSSHEAFGARSMLIFWSGLGLALWLVLIRSIIRP